MAKAEKRDKGNQEKNLNDNANTYVCLAICYFLLNPKEDSRQGYKI